MTQGEMRTTWFVVRSKLERRMKIRRQGPASVPATKPISHLGHVVCVPDPDCPILRASHGGVPVGGMPLAPAQPAHMALGVLLYKEKVEV